MSRNKAWKKWAAFAMTVAILLAIYSQIDLDRLIRQLAHIHALYFGAALFLFVPQILFTSLRWQQMVKGIRYMSLSESVRLVLAGKALNAMVPSKLGEMSKAFFLKRDSGADTAQSVSVVLLEKVLDVGALCTVLLLGLLWIPEWHQIEWVGAVAGVGLFTSVGFILLVPSAPLAKRISRLGTPFDKAGRLLVGWEAVLDQWKGRGGTLYGVMALSIFLWCLHVLQILLFFPSLHQSVPVAAAVAYLPMAIFVGLLPITIAGMGTRDSALILLFLPYADPAVMAGVGLLCSMRYWVDTLLGVPFFHRYTTEDPSKACWSR